jgi:hypothetical protein
MLRIQGEKGAWNGRLEGARRAFNRCEAGVETGWRLRGDADVRAALEN